MDDIIKSVVQLTKLCNQVPVDSKFEPSILDVETEDKANAKAQKQAAKKMFDQIVDLNKYINPVNSKALEEMKK